jgi:hypothetical protein
LIVFQLGKRLESHPEKIILQGIYVHCGNSYAADSVEGVEKVEDFKKKNILKRLKTSKKIVHCLGNTVKLG